MLVFPVGAHLDPGDHAFLSYGKVSNDDLLQYYGFVERQNPSDTYVMQDMGKNLRKVRRRGHAMIGGVGCNVAFNLGTWTVVMFKWGSGSTDLKSPRQKSTVATVAFPR